MQKSTNIIQIFLTKFAFFALVIMLVPSYALYSLSTNAWIKEDWKNFKYYSDAQFDLVEHLLKTVKTGDMLEAVSAEGKLSDGSKFEFLSKQDMNLTEIGREMIRTNNQKYLSPFTDPYWFAAYQIVDCQCYLLITRSGNRSLFVGHLKWVWLVIFALAFTAIFWFSIYILCSLVRKPIKHIVESAEKVNLGDFDIRMKADTIEPFNKLAQAFNLMADNLQKTCAQKEIMLTAIPHELKTPLTKLSFMIEMGKARKTKPELLQMLNEIEGGVCELQSAINQVIELTDLEDIDFFRTTLFKPYELFNNKTALLEPNLRHKVELDIDPNLMLRGNKNLLARAFYNVLTNSVRYASSKSLVTVLVEDDGAIVRVEDDGFGVSVEQQETVFEAFTKSDLSRGENGVGMGLGLAVVRLIMNKHGGTAKMSGSQFGGACVEMRWPNAIVDMNT